MVRRVWQSSSRHCLYFSLFFVVSPFREIVEKAGHEARKILRVKKGWIKELEHRLRWFEHWITYQPKSPSSSSPAFFLLCSDQQLGKYPSRDSCQFHGHYLPITLNFNSLLINFKLMSSFHL